MTKMEQGRILRDFNKNFWMVRDEVQSVADTLEFIPENKTGWERYAPSDKARELIIYVLQIAETGLVAMNKFNPYPKVEISFHYANHKEIVFSDGVTTYSLIRSENAFALFMGICYVLNVKPKRINKEDGSPISINCAGTFSIELPMCLTLKETYESAVQTSQTVLVKDWELLVQIKDVLLVLSQLTKSAVSGKHYPSWVKYYCKIYNKYEELYKGRLASKYEVALVEFWDGRNSVALVGYNDDGERSNLIFVPGTEKDYLAYLEKYNKDLQKIRY